MIQRKPGQGTRKVRCRQKRRSHNPRPFGVVALSALISTSKFPCLGFYSETPQQCYASARRPSPRTLITDHRAGRIPRAGKRAGEGERGIATLSADGLMLLFSRIRGKRLISNTGAIRVINVGRTNLMSFILIPNKGEDVQINAWNWRPTLEFLRARNVITSEQAELLGYNGCGARVDADMANQIAEAIENKLSTMAPGDRMRADLTVTSVPKAPQVFRPSPRPGDIDDNELYSATYEWLVTFKDFCKLCDGFMVS